MRETKTPALANRADADVVPRQLPPFRHSLAGRLLAAREAVMAPLRPILREAGVTEQQWRVLRVLIDVTAIDVSSLALAALLRLPSLTRILRELDERGLIAREGDRDDGRRIFVWITPRGRHLVDETTGATLALLDRYAASFGVERLRALIDELALFTATVSRQGI
jgi:homoprotocatechuate degradation regulator HpaR